MTAQLRPLTDADVETVQDFTVRAFAPVFASFRSILGETLFPMVFPDWEQTQRKLVTSLPANDLSTAIVAVVDGVPAGFLVYRVGKDDDTTGEIEFLVVDPAYHGRGIGTQLNQHALDQLREAGMTLATVSTGGDPSHAAARHAYEKVGFVGVPNVWYVKQLIVTD